MKLNKKIIFFARKNDSYSKELFNILKSKFKYVKVILCNTINEKIDFKKIEKINFDYIFSFRFLFKIPPKIIDKSSIAINFHLGPPEFRGVGCANFAIYKSSKSYGVTAHLMNNKLDSGLILNVERFPIKRGILVEDLLEKSYKKQIIQAKKIIKIVCKDAGKIINKKKNNNFKWSKKITTRKDLNKLYHIPIKTNKKNLKKIIQSTYTSNYKPYLLLKGIKFFYEK